jgi:GNAT superfamily N-acetyltransferase
MPRRRRRHLRGRHLLLQGRRQVGVCRHDCRPVGRALCPTSHANLSGINPDLQNPAEDESRDRAQHGAYLISDDPARLDAVAIHGYLTRSYWSERIPLETVRRALQGSLCIGAYDAGGKQVGLIRIISDHATYAYLCDVYVLEEHRRHGLSKAMLALTLSHPQLQGLRSWNLRTRDAHGLYAQFGFKPVEQPASYMALRFPDVYRQPNGDE